MPSLAAPAGEYATASTLKLAPPRPARVQGENNLAYHAGNVVDRSGYACLLPALIASWRAAWSAAEGTTDPSAPFGIVTLADSTDEGFGCNVPQMHWAQTANVGYAPNEHLPGTFLATAHDLPDPWDDDCDKGAACCVDTGAPPDARCGPHRGWLAQTGAYPGVSEPVTPSHGFTIHPRTKYQVGARLAQAAWARVYGHTEVAWTGPVLGGCAVATSASGERVLRIRFNRTLLGADAVALRPYNRSERASVTWVKVGAPVPGDGSSNWVYENRAAWWGDDGSWHNVDIALLPDGLTIEAALPEGEVTAVQYGHLSPRGHPQNGHDKICCGDRDFKLDPCPPESCPISLRDGGLPAMPFHAAIVDGKCKCFAPQTCDEDVVG